MTKEHIERAVELATSQSKLADAIGVKQQTISNWMKGGAIRPEHCSAIERFTDGAVTRRDLRPDDWQQIWPELASAPIRELPPTPMAERAAA